MYFIHFLAEVPMKPTVVPTKPVPTKPAATKPAPTKPAATKPAATKPAPTVPAPSKFIRHIVYYKTVNCM